MVFWIWVGLIVVATLAVPVAALLDRMAQAKPAREESPLIDEQPVSEESVMEEVPAEAPAAEEGGSFDLGEGMEGFGGFNEEDFK